MNLDVIVALLTPFEEDGRLALDRLDRYIQYLLNSGANGFLALGTNGEFSSLTVAERQAVTSRVLALATGQVPVFVNVGACSLGDSLALAQHAETVGAAGIAVLPPYYTPLTDEGLSRYVAAVAASVHLPTYLYNIPRYTRYAIGPELVRRLAQEAGIRGLKESAKDLSDFSRMRQENPDLTLLIGSDSGLLDGMRLGANGAVSGMANTFPELVIDAVAACRAGAWDRAAALHAKMMALKHVLEAYPYLSATREAIRLRGLDLGPPRLPLIAVNAQQRGELKGHLGRLDLGPYGASIS